MSMNESSEVPQVEVVYMEVHGAIMEILQAMLQASFRRDSINVTIKSANKHKAASTNMWIYIKVACSAEVSKDFFQALPEDCCLYKVLAQMESLEDESHLCVQYPLTSVQEKESETQDGNLSQEVESQQKTGSIQQNLKLKDGSLEIQHEFTKQKNIQDTVLHLRVNTSFVQILTDSKLLQNSMSHIRIFKPKGFMSLSIKVGEVVSKTDFKVCEWKKIPTLCCKIVTDPAFLLQESGLMWLESTSSPVHGKPTVLSFHGVTKDNMLNKQSQVQVTCVGLYIPVMAPPANSLLTLTLYGPGNIPIDTHGLKDAQILQEIDWRKLDLKLCSAAMAKPDNLPYQYVVHLAPCSKHTEMDTFVIPVFLLIEPVHSSDNYFTDFRFIQDNISSIVTQHHQSIVQSIGNIVEKVLQPVKATVKTRQVVQKSIESVCKAITDIVSLSTNEGFRKRVMASLQVSDTVDVRSTLEDKLKGISQRCHHGVWRGTEGSDSRSRKVMLYHRTLYSNPYLKSSFDSSFLLAKLDTTAVSQDRMEASQADGAGSQAQANPAHRDRTYMTGKGSQLSQDILTCEAVDLACVPGNPNNDNNMPSGSLYQNRSISHNYGYPSLSNPQLTKTVYNSSQDKVLSPNSAMQEDFDHIGSLAHDDCESLDAQPHITVNLPSPFSEPGLDISNLSHNICSQSLLSQPPYNISHLNHEPIRNSFDTTSIHNKDNVPASDIALKQSTKDLTKTELTKSPDLRLVPDTEVSPFHELAATSTPGTPATVDNDLTPEIAKIIHEMSEVSPFQELALDEKGDHGLGQLVDAADSMYHSPAGNFLEDPVINFHEDPCVPDFANATGSQSTCTWRRNTVLEQAQTDKWLTKGRTRKLNSSQHGNGSKSAKISRKCNSRQYENDPNCEKNDPNWDSISKRLTTEELMASEEFAPTYDIVSTLVDELDSCGTAADFCTIGQQVCEAEHFDEWPTVLKQSASDKERGTQGATGYAAIGTNTLKQPLLPFQDAPDKNFRTECIGIFKDCSMIGEQAMLLNKQTIVGDQAMLLNMQGGAITSGNKTESQEHIDMLTVYVIDPSKMKAQAPFAKQQENTTIMGKTQHQTPLNKADLNDKPTNVDTVAGQNTLPLATMEGKADVGKPSIVGNEESTDWFNDVLMEVDNWLQH